MSGTEYWTRCVDHRGDDVRGFAEELFGQSHRLALLIGGSGFDPRSTTVAQLLAGVMGKRLRGFFFKEERPGASAPLTKDATENQQKLQTLIDDLTVRKIAVFALDDAVIGGREAAKAAAGITLDGLTDVIIDCSALSVGVFFPVVRFFLQAALQGAVENVHLFVASNPELDRRILPLSAESPSLVHGFRGELDLDRTRDAASLWFPQLAAGRRGVLELIHRELAPHDVCPILPFPSADPRAGDNLLHEFREQLRDSWSVDERNLIYADETNPLDVYRTITRIDDERKTIFEGVGGSISVLSPVGSKSLAIGAMMAAIERDFPVMYVEALGYQADGDILAEGVPRDPDLRHVWLAGEAYLSGAGGVKNG